MLFICFVQGILWALLLPIPLGAIAGAVFGFVIGINADRFGDHLDVVYAEMEAEMRESERDDD